MPGEALCVRCPENGRNGKDGRPAPFKALPGYDFCWACASEEEREQAWGLTEDSFGVLPRELGRLFFYEVGEGKKYESWREAFDAAREYMRERGYEPQDDPKQADLENDKWFFLVNWEGALLEKTELGGKCLAFSNLNNADLSWARLENTDLYAASLENANLFGASLENASLYAASLGNADLCAASLENASLFGARLENTKLFEVSLENSRLSFARLENAKLFAASLKNADLFGASLENADLYWARLEGAKLCEADIREAMHLRAEQFGRGVGDEIEFREDVYRELAAYWRALGYNEDEDWARVKMHRARILRMLTADGTVSGRFLPDGLRASLEGGLVWPLAVLVAFIVCIPSHIYKFISRALEKDWNKAADAAGSLPKNLALPVWFLLLDLISKFGTSVGRAVFFTIAIPVYFAYKYFNLNYASLEQTGEFFLRMAEGFRYKPLLTELYYSVITFVTLGYGDIGPKNALGQALSIVEVALGYTMLGVLVSVIARKMSR